MQTKKVRACDIHVSGTAFAYDTDPLLVRCHCVGLYVGKRGSGKNLAATALLERLKFHRIFVITPTESFQSNKEQMDRLNVSADDVFDCDDVGSVDKIIAAMNQERDDWEKYKADLARYERLMKLIRSDRPIHDIPPDILQQFFVHGDFVRPKHKYNGARPMCAVLFDDVLCSPVLLKGIRKVNSLVIRHRHISPLKEGGALGISVFFLTQTYRCQVGGISKAIRGQCTFLCLFRTKNKNELHEVMEEAAGEVAPETFLRVYDQAVQDKHDFLMVDFHPRDPSMQFRRGYNEIIIPT